MTTLLLLHFLLAQAPAAPPCSAPEYRQFDFWIGDWVVHNPNRQQVGTNRIEKIAGGCALQENWTSARGTNGRSINAYHALRRTWVQHWVDDSGSILLLEGRYEGDKMILRGSSPAPSGNGTVKDRITWSRLPDGRVRQLWEQSSDDGKTWTVAFDGVYSARTR